MNPLGEFREGIVDGKPFLIFTWLSQTVSSSSSSLGEAAFESGGDDLPSQPLFICPFMRGNTGENHSFGAVVVPPQFPCIQNDQQQPEYMLRSNNCKLPLLPLFWCNNKESSSPEIFCRACDRQEHSTSYYFCVTCGNKFHKECVASPLEFKHPSYPSISLQLYSCPFGIQCSCCNVETNGMCYYCPTKNFCLCLFCSFKPIPFLINQPKRHPHPLTFFPKQVFLPCNVCGLIKELLPTYVCLQCVFVVHEECIYFPYLIRICRHSHRLSYTPSLPSGILSCGVCRKKVDNDYGAYSCKTCDYFVHTRCALRRDLWDGKELERIPEEPEIIVEPFKRIVDGIILHFSHDHHLKLEMSKVYDQHKICQACVLPIYEGSYYTCIHGCDFILHEACANEPCKKYHPLHFSPLTLVVVTDEYDEYEGCFKCDACQRGSCGFVYTSPGKYPKFRLCVRCASVSEPFIYQGHDHPLFLALTPEEENLAACQICQVVRRHYGSRKLNCIECDFVICFECATLPYKAKYQHDKHFLTFYKEKEAKDHSEWCDVCERKIEDPIDKEIYSRNKGFYSCDDCCTILHIDCLLGVDMYMKPGQTISQKLAILHNNTLSRPKCHCCSKRCSQKVVFKYQNYAFCAGYCLS